MANPEHLEIIKQDVSIWNSWRDKDPAIKPDLSNARLMHANLDEVDFRNANLLGANLSNANLTRAKLIGANLSNANFSGAELMEANLTRAKLIGVNFYEAHLLDANFSGAELSETNFTMAKLIGANLSNANLFKADLGGAELAYGNLSNANLSGALLSGASLSEANLTGANLLGANLERSVLVRTNLEMADLSGCRIYGISAWDLKLKGASQTNLVITRYDLPAITVDNLEVVQFLYVLLYNPKIRHVIDTITSKVVLILGRFTDERKAVLDAIREEFRKRDCIPILFDFDKPASKDVTGTVETLARMARFIVADLTDPSSIPHELATIVPFLRTTPIVPLRLRGSSGYGMFDEYEASYKWVLPKYEYDDTLSLIEALPERVIAPAVKKLEELRGK